MRARAKNPPPRPLGAPVVRKLLLRQGKLSPADAGVDADV
jgi:hypothetical protein